MAASDKQIASETYSKRTEEVDKMSEGSLAGGPLASAKPKLPRPANLVQANNGNMTAKSEGGKLIGESSTTLNNKRQSLAAKTADGKEVSHHITHRSDKKILLSVAKQGEEGAASSNYDVENFENEESKGRLSKGTLQQENNNSADKYSSDF